MTATVNKITVNPIEKKLCELASRWFDATNKEYSMDIITDEGKMITLNIIERDFTE